MKETVSFNSSEVLSVKNENVSAILLDIKAQTAADAVCDIANLNEASLEIAVYRKGASRPEYFCNDYLDYVLRALTAASMRYTIATTKRTLGYLIAIPFSGSLDLKGDDRLEIIFKVPEATFTFLDASKSGITVETVPAKINQPILSVVESVTYSSGDNEIDKSLGNNIEKIVFVNDLTADYDASTKAKPVNGVILTGANFEKRASENLLIAENLDVLQENPETAVKNLVVFNNLYQPLSMSRLTCKFDKAVDTDARVMILRRKVL